VRNLRAKFEQKEDARPVVPERPLAPSTSGGAPVVWGKGIGLGLFRADVPSQAVSMSAAKTSKTIRNLEYLGLQSTDISNLKAPPVPKVSKATLSISKEKCDVQSDNLMARNPYSGLSANTDPYTNGNSSYGASTTSSITEEYDPYGDRYGTPPISSSSSRERRGGRTGGYGGFYEDSNRPAPAVPPAAQQQDRFDGYGQRSEEEPIARSSPNRRPYVSGRSNARNYIQDRSDADSEGSRGPEYRRGGERRVANGNSHSNDLAVDRSRGVPGGGGDGTRQIEGQ